jgi:sugar lactone lactonase YvrE
MLSLADLDVAADGLDHPEGVSVDASGAVWAGGQSGQLYAVDVAARSHEQVLSTGGSILGLCLDGQGDVYACDVNLRAVVRARPRTGEWQVLSHGNADHGFRCPNFPVLDDEGNLYVTDSGLFDHNDGWIAKITPDGTTLTWCDESTGFPNGAVLANDGTSLVVIESTTPALVRIPIRGDGSAGGREVIAPLTDLAPDGVLALQEGGFLVFCYRPDRVVHVTADGELSTVLDDPRGVLLNTPTNGVLTGPERRTLVLASLGAHTLKQIEVPYRGSALRYPPFGPRQPATPTSPPSVAEV